MSTMMRPRCLTGAGQRTPLNCAAAVRGRAPVRRSALRPQANLFGKLFGGGGAEQKASQPATNASPEVFLMSNNRQSASPEFPPYTVVKRSPAYDLRFYDVYPVVEMDYSRREEGYAFLGSYIDGGNAAGTRFGYSQPVVMRYYPSGRKVMQMYLGTRTLSDGSVQPPAKATEALTSLPLPSRTGVQLSVAGGELVAVMKFEGYITPSTAESAKRQLLAALETDGVKLAEEEAAGYFRCGQYGAVYQLGGRLNELMLRVSP